MGKQIKKIAVCSNFYRLLVNLVAKTGLAVKQDFLWWEYFYTSKWSEFRLLLYYLKNEIILRYFIYFYFLTVYKISKLENTMCDITETTFLPKEKYLLLLRYIITGSYSVKYPLEMIRNKYPDKYKMLYVSYWFSPDMNVMILKI